MQFRTVSKRVHIMLLSTCTVYSIYGIYVHLVLEFGRCRRGKGEETLCPPG